MPEGRFYKKGAWGEKHYSGGFKRVFPPNVLLDRRLVGSGKTYPALQGNGPLKIVARRQKKCFFIFFMPSVLSTKSGPLGSLSS